MRIFRRTQRCSCGAELDPLDIHYKFQLPDEVFAMTPEERTEQIHGFSTLLRVRDEIGYVRTLLPIRMSRGSVTLGIWLKVDVDQVNAAGPIWDDEAYMGVRFSGTIANQVELWGTETLGLAATASPRTQDALPYVDGGENRVQDLLTRTWDRAGMNPDLAIPHTH